MTTAQRPDGRTARRDRNTDAVLDTVHEMFTEGNFAPSVEEVAARSGVSLRSVYRYFEDSEELLRLAIQRRVGQVEGLYDLPDQGEGPLQERVAALVDQRLLLHRRLGPSIRAALLRAPYSPQIGEQVLARRRQLSDQVAGHFAPELAAFGDDADAIAACVDALCEFEAIDHLRRIRRMSAARTRAALTAGVLALLRPPK